MAARFSRPLLHLRSMTYGAFDPVAVPTPVLTDVVFAEVLAAGWGSWPPIYRVLLCIPRNLSSLLTSFLFPFLLFLYHSSQVVEQLSHNFDDIIQGKDPNQSTLIVHHR